MPVLKALLIEAGESIEHFATGATIESGWIGQVEGGLVTATELNSLVSRREEAAPPEPGIESLSGFLAHGNHGDIGGQIFAQRTKSIGQPGTHAGVPEVLGAGVDISDGRIVIDSLRIHRTNHRDLVGDARDVG